MIHFIKISKQYMYFSNPVTGLRIRVGNRGNTQVIDKELIYEGFEMDHGRGEGEGVGWEFIGGAM
jgi:hypothetical protein